MMSLLECEVLSVLETLVKVTVVKMVRVLDESVLCKLTESDNVSLSQEFTSQLNAVLEMQVKEAVKKICSLFSETSAVLHLHLTPSQTTQDNLKRKQKQKSVVKKPKSVSKTKSAVNEIPSGQQAGEAPVGRISTVSQCWTEEKVLDDEITESLFPSVQQSTVGEFIINKEKEPAHSLENAIDNSRTNSEEENICSLQEKVDVPSERVWKETDAFTVLSDVREIKFINKRTSCQTRDSKLSCNVCRRTFSKLMYLRAHQALHAGVEKPLSHSQCGKSKHTSNAHGPYICCQCGKSFIHERGLQNHELLHNMSREGKGDGEFFSRTQKQHNCDTCGKSFVSLSNLHRHQRIHTGEKPFTCRTCGKCFNQLDTLKSHERIHTGEKPFMCKSCGAAFSQASSLRVHDGQYIGQKGFSCVICGLESPCVSALKMHHETHTEDMSPSCRICGDSIGSLRSLQDHQHQHDCSKFHSCGFCGKSFLSAGNLKIHERTHTGERPFCCSVCSKTFTQQNTLKNHQLSHTGERPYSCDVCLKGFSSVGNLQRHKRIHTGQKPYSCDVCERSFNQLNTLKAHKYVHTGEKRYTCDKCGRSFGYQRNLKSHKCTYK